MSFAAPVHLIIIIATIATIMTTKTVKNIGGGPEWSFASGPPDTFARPCILPCFLRPPTFTHSMCIVCPSLSACSSLLNYIIGLKFLEYFSTSFLL
jgi:hypothetical protein